MAFKIMWDVVFDATKYICIHGKLVKADDTLTGAYTYSFQKPVAGIHLVSSRQFLDQFDTYNELKSSFPGQNVPDEKML